MLPSLLSEAVSTWHRLILPALQSFQPMKSACSRPANKPWYSPYLHRLARARDRLFRRSRRCPASVAATTAYKKVRNLYVKELRGAKRRYCWDLSQQLSSANLKRNSHRWWSTLKKACGWSARDCISPLVQDNQLHLSEMDKAKVLNDFFARQCSAPSMPVQNSSSLSAHDGEQFSFHEISAAEVAEELHSLDVWKASGLDQLSAQLLKGCANELAWSLSRVFNISLAAETYPEQWKEALVVPLHKSKGDKCVPSSYRPISILSCASKVFGRLLKKQIISFCLDHDIIPDNQFGFMPGRSTVWQLLLVIETWQEALDAGHTVHALFLDVAKAFDRVDHDRLLLKLRAVGFGPAALNWVCSYLKGRVIRTIVNGSMSELKPISSGVPQGSVLGPLLFIIFFADLPAAVQSTPMMYADDTLLYDTDCQRCGDASGGSTLSGQHSASCVCTVARDTANLSTWAQNSGTVFNPSKSVAMAISRSNRCAVGELSLNGEVILHQDSTKHLGVVLTTKLSWSSHIEYLLRKVAPKVLLLKRMAFHLHLPQSVISRCYLSMVRPVLEYASPVWINCSKKDSRTLEKLQLQAARAARHGCAPLRDCDLLEQLNWPTLAWRRRQQCLLLLWRLMHHQGPPKLEALIPPTADARTHYALRKSQTIAFPHCTTHAHNSSFLPATIALWNDLPASIQSSKSLHSFRSALSHHFRNNRFTFGLV